VPPPAGDTMRPENRDQPQLGSFVSRPADGTPLSRSRDRVASPGVSAELTPKSDQRHCPCLERMTPRSFPS
jgi:hypothetical protein